MASDLCNFVKMETVRVIVSPQEGGARASRQGDPEGGSVPLTSLRVITILGMVTVQVALVCVWRLVTMVRRGTVFSHAAFRYVDAVIGAIVAAALVLRMLLAQAVARDVEAAQMQAELGEVI